MLYYRGILGIIILKKLLLPLTFKKESKFDFLHGSLHLCKDVEVSPSVTNYQAEQACQVRDV